jgi:prophage regulatory protein
MVKDQPNTRILRMRDICLKTGLSQSTLHDLVARGVFPKPFTLIPGGRAVGWLEANVDQWIFKRHDDADSNSSLRGAP